MGKQNNQDYSVLIGIGIFALILFYGSQHNWFIGEEKQNGIVLTPNQTQVQISSCNQLCKSNNFIDGYSASDISKCQPGEFFYSYGYPNQAPILSCCCRKTIPISCSASADKTVITEGEEVIGTIIDGANTKCEIFMNKDNTGWIKSEEGITDNNGKLVIMNSLMEGVYQFYAKCGSCTTNTVTITSNKAPIYKCCNIGTPNAICRPSNCLSGEFESPISFTTLTNCQNNCIAGGGGGLLCSEVINPTSQASCDIANCNSGICTFVRGSLKCECKTPNDFCSQSCTNSFAPGGRGPVNALGDCNPQVEFAFIQGYSGGTDICCCNNFDTIGCGRYGGSFGYTRNSLVMPESTLNYCSEVAFMDCQSTGKTVKNYNLISNCCMWNCN